MPTTLELEPPPALPRGVDLPTEDGENLESAWHLKSMWLLIASVEQHWLGRDDFYTGGNQFFYFDPKQARNTKFQGPDFYVVKGVNRFPIRPSWVTWEEGWRVPNVIVELLSPSTADHDRTYKKKVYLQDLDVREYYCFDPDGDVLEGWRKNGKRKPTAIPLQDGRLWSEELELFLGTWEGVYLRDRQTWLRMFDANGNLSLIADEVEKRDKEAALAELAKLRADLAALKTTPTA